jgi:hypothetical protein
MVATMIFEQWAQANHIALDSPEAVRFRACWTLADRAARRDCLTLAEDLVAAGDWHEIVDAIRDSIPGAQTWR